MADDKEIEFYRGRQSEDFQLLDSAAIRLAGYGLELECVDLDKDGRIQSSRFSVLARVQKAEAVKDKIIPPPEE